MATKIKAGQKTSKLGTKLEFEIHVHAEDENRPGVQKHTFYYPGYFFSKYRIQWDENSTGKMRWKLLRRHPDGSRNYKEFPAKFRDPQGAALTLANHLAFFGSI